MSLRIDDFASFGGGERGRVGSAALKGQSVGSGWLKVWVRCYVAQAMLDGLGGSGNPALRVKRGHPATPPS